MGFKIAEGTPTIKQYWMPLNVTSSAVTLYVGQLVKKYHAVAGTYNGLTPMAAALGGADYRGGQVIYGVVTGTNNYPLTELNNATYGQYITGIAAAAGQLAIQKMGHGGSMHPVGDPMPMVQIAKIDATTVLEAPIYNGTYGTAITLLTATGTPTTTSISVNACQFTPTTTNMSTTYCRTGANAGIYRVNQDTSTTTMTFADNAWPYTPAAGDTFVRVPYTQGTGPVQINSTSTYIGMCLDASAAPATNYFMAEVLSLNLREAGKEKALISFNPIHFIPRLVVTT
jgi:hypothetical protein